MMVSFAQVGNDLYTGKRSVDIVGGRRKFYLLSAAVIALALVGLLVRGVNLSLEFRGGSEFRVSNSTSLTDYETRAQDVVSTVEAGTAASVTRLGTGTVRVQTEKLSDAQATKVRDALASEFGVPTTDVSASFVGPSWGASVSRAALKALVIFLLLVSLAMALYFRTWKMALAALIALAHDLLITVGIYALVGFEVSPATVIGFLTILGYSLYDTVVVFDKVRENTASAFANSRMSFAQAANLAVNQTLVRSINTTVVALLPVAAILVVGFTMLGPGTLLDLSLALFIGMAVGAYSSIFIATPALVSMRANEPAVIDLAKRAARRDAKRGSTTPAAVVAADQSQGGAEVDLDHSAVASVDQPTRSIPGESDATTVTGRKVHKYAQSGPRNQPKRAPKSKR